MSEAAVSLGSAGELNLSGVLDFRSGPALRKEGQALIKGWSGPSLVVDCSAVGKSSSVGLSLLLAFMRDAKAAGKSLKIRALTDDMREIAEVYGVVELLEAG
ncbi:STAS domain-containing protein [Pseudomonas akapageensis]|uniref:STAS domain-containing protein n=1 Tax=Pseudomonas akapageensis TaxID=2609961 RepID=UPI001408C76D|nr:STAS domain-containing protein [Pseudomonas akapageensis]